MRPSITWKGDNIKEIHEISYFARKKISAKTSAKIDTIFSDVQNFSLFYTSYFLWENFLTYNVIEKIAAKRQNFRFNFDYYFSLYCKYFGKIIIFLFSSIFVIFIYICTFDRNLRENAKNNHCLLQAYFPLPHTTVVVANISC